MSNIEEYIRRAMLEGKFDDLPGKGKPLRLDDDVHSDPEWRLAYHMLQSSGFSLPWIESRKEIESELLAARTALQRAWSWRVDKTAEGGALPETEKEWQRACAAFRAAIEALNKKIATYNLEAPSPQLHLRLVNAERELELTVEDHSDTLAGTDSG